MMRMMISRQSRRRNLSPSLNQKKRKKRRNKMRTQLSCLKMTNMSPITRKGIGWD